MATPNTTFVSGAILTATQQNNLAWGSVGTALKSTDQTFTTRADMAGLSITFTAVANRIYQVTFVGNIFATAGADVTLYLTDGTTDFHESLGSILTTAPYETRSFVVSLTTLTAGTKTLKIAGAANTSTIMYGTGIRASIGAKMAVNDIGAA